MCYMIGKIITYDTKIFKLAEMVALFVDHHHANLKRDYIGAHMVPQHGQSGNLL